MRGIYDKRLPLIVAIFLFFFGEYAKAQNHAVIKLHGYTVLKNVEVFGFDSTGVFVKGRDDNGYQKLYFSDIKMLKFLPGTSSIKEQTENIKNDSPVQKLYHHFATGVLAGNHEKDFSLGIVNGYRINDYVGAGMGVGYNRYDRASMLPLFTEVKGYMIKGNFIPYYFLQAGYGFMVENRLGSSFGEVRNGRGGFLWNAGVGYQISWGSHFITFSFEYHHQQSKQEFSFGDFLDVEEKRTYRRAGVKVGVLF